MNEEPSTVEAVVDLIRRPGAGLGLAISREAAIALVEQYAAVVASGAAIKATSEAHDRTRAAFDAAMSKPLAPVGTDCTCLMCLAEGENSPHRLRATPSRTPAEGRD